MYTFNRINALIKQPNVVGHIIILIFWWGNWGTDRLNNLLKVKN